MRLRLALLFVICIITTACDRGYLPDSNTIDTPKELVILIKSAEEGDSKAQLLLAAYNSDNKNYIEAEKWMSLAAEKEKISADNLKKFRENMSAMQIAAGQKLAEEWKAKKAKQKEKKK